MHTCPAVPRLTIRSTLSIHSTFVHLSGCSQVDDSVNPLQLCEGDEEGLDEDDHIYKIYTHILKYLRTYMHIYLHACMHTHMHAYMHAYMHIHAYIPTCKHTRIPAYTHAYMHKLVNP